MVISLTVLANHLPDLVGLFVQLLTHATSTKAAIVQSPSGSPGGTGRERERGGAGGRESVTVSESGLMLLFIPAFTLLQTSNVFWGESNFGFGDLNTAFYFSAQYLHKGQSDQIKPAVTTINPNLFI